MNTGTLLAVWAHPDDEAYLSAGLMATARRRGDRVVVVTATAGERGTDDPRRWPPRRLAARRRRELRAALATIGVTEMHVLGLPDGACAGLDEDRMASLLAEFVSAVEPDTIVTFGPDGMTGHPDHVAVSAWTTGAWHLAGERARLWYATLTPGFHARWSDLNERLGLWSYGTAPPSHEAHELSCHLELSGPVLDQKVAALRAHASQTDPVVALVGEGILRSWWSAEAFVDAPPPSPALRRTPEARATACR